jgi:xylulokinase
VRPGDASLALGTSGVLFAAGDRFRPHPERAVHAFCHAVPGAWHQMSVVLSAASCLHWVTQLVGARDEAALLAEIEATRSPPGSLLFLPYLSGERTPHNDPNAQGVFFGLQHDTDRAALGRAVLEGVAFAFADAQAVLLEAGAELHDVTLIGGGARSRLWARILASVLERPLALRAGGEIGPALGAARLARLGTTGASAAESCPPPPAQAIVEPDAEWVAAYRAPLARWRTLYARTRDLFAAGSSVAGGTR